MIRSFPLSGNWEGVKELKRYGAAQERRLLPRMACLASYTCGIPRHGWAAVVSQCIIARCDSPFSGVGHTLSNSAPTSLYRTELSLRVIETIRGGTGGLSELSNADHRIGLIISRLIGQNISRRLHCGSNVGAICSRLGLHII